MNGEPAFAGPARRRAERVFEETVALFRKAGYRVAARPAPLRATLESRSGAAGLRLAMTKTGRVFGGTYALEVSTAAAVLPPTRGLAARGRGLVRLRGVSFRARRGDEAGRRLAERLEADGRLVDRLGRVHFEAVRVEPDGRAVVRHMGGAIVWILFPPLVRPIPLIPEQVAATVDALEAFAAAGPRARSS